MVLNLKVSFFRNYQNWLVYVNEGAIPLPRNAWQLGMVTAKVVNDDGLVCTVRIAVGVKTLDESGRRDKPLPTVEQPIHKVMLLHKTETREVPTEEP